MPSKVGVSGMKPALFVSVSVARYAFVLGGATTLNTPLVKLKDLPPPGLPAMLAKLLVFVAPVPLLTMGTAGRLALAVYNRRDVEPFLATLGLFVLCYIGLGISLYPNIVPPGISIWEAAAPDRSLGFLLVGAVILIPVILVYTAYAYWVFRGKVDLKEGYH